MQERRTTVRVRHQEQVHYRASDALLPQAGRLLNLSERGVGLLTREAHRVGEQISLSFDGEHQGLTASGVVRWSQERPTRSSWYPLGLEWLPLEETARHRLETLLKDATPAASKTRVSFALSDGPAVRRLILLWCLVGCVIASPLCLWIWSLRHENQRLQTTIQQRDMLINGLEHHAQALQQELGAAKIQLTHTVSQVMRLDQQSQHLAGDVQRLTNDVAQVQQSYLQVREEREALMQRVLALEQQRLELARRLSSIPDLRVAIRDAVRARTEAQRAQRRAPLQARQETGPSQGGQGNRGYLVRGGQPTVSRSTVWIRVHEPETISGAPFLQSSQR